MWLSFNTRAASSCYITGNRNQQFTSPPSYRWFETERRILHQSLLHNETHIMPVANSQQQKISYSFLQLYIFFTLKYFWPDLKIFTSFCTCSFNCELQEHLSIPFRQHIFRKRRHLPSKRRDTLPRFEYQSSTLASPFTTTSVFTIHPLPLLLPSMFSPSWSNIGSQNLLINQSADILAERSGLLVASCGAAESRLCSNETGICAHFHFYINLQS